MCRRAGARLRFRVSGDRGAVRIPGADRTGRAGRALPAAEPLLPPGGDSPDIGADGRLEPHRQRTGLSYGPDRRSIRRICERHPFRALRGALSHPPAHRRQARREVRARPERLRLDRQPDQDHGEFGHFGAPPAAGRAHPLPPGRSQVRPACLVASDDLRRESRAAPTDAPCRTAGALEPRFLGAAARRLRVGHRAPARHGADHRTYRLGQEHDALCDAPAAEPRVGQHPYDRGPGRIHARGSEPGTAQRGDRPDLRRCAAHLSASGPGHHHARRDPRRRYGGDGDPQLADGPSRVLDDPYEQRMGQRLAAAGHGRASVPALRHADPVRRAAARPPAVSRL